MAEYIEREATKKEFNIHFGDVHDAVIANRLIDSIQAADVAPVRHGCTVPAEQPKKVLLDRNCGICDSLMLSTDVYCQNCGSRMDLEVSDGKS